MNCDLNRKLRRWGKDDEIAKAEDESQKGIDRLRVLNSRLEILLGSAITSLLFAAGVLILHVAGRL